MIDFLVTEAVILKSMNAERKASVAQREAQIMTRWKAGEISTEDAQRLKTQIH